MGSERRRGERGGEVRERGGQVREEGEEMENKGRAQESGVRGESGEGRSIHLFLVVYKIETMYNNKMKIVNTK